MAQFLTELKSRNQFSTLCCDGINHNAQRFILSRSCPVKITEIFSTKSQPNEVIEDEFIIRENETLFWLLCLILIYETSKKSQYIDSILEISVHAIKTGFLYWEY